MKKRIISALLALMVIFSSTITVFAENETSSAPDKYYEMELPFIYETGRINEIYTTFMIPGDESCVYIKAENIEEFLNVNYFDFKFNQTFTQCALVSDSLDFAVMYEFNTNKVFVYAAGSTIEYKSPVPTLYKNGVCWLPFEFTMKMFNVRCLPYEDRIVIEPPKITGLMIVSALYGNIDYSFDWVTETGKSKFSKLLMKGSAATVNALNGVITFKTHSWVDLLSLNFANSTERYYAKEIAQLFVTPSQSELIEMDDSILTTFTEVSSATVSAGTTVTDGITFDKLNTVFSKVLKEFPGLKSDVRVNNFLKGFSANKGTLEKFTKVSGEVGSAYSLAMRAINVSQYYLSFYNKSENSSAVLINYANKTDAEAHEKLKEIASTTKDDTFKIVSQYFEKNGMDILADSLPLSSILGGPAVLTLLGWKILSNTIPYFKDGLKSTDTFELMENAVYYQNDAKELMRYYKNDVFKSTNVSKSDFKNVADLAYAYLKFSIIARSGANTIISLNKNNPDEAKDYFEKKFSEKNQSISLYLNTLDAKDYGFFPEDVKSQKWQPEEFIDIIKSIGTELDTVSQGLVPLDEIANLPDDSIISEEEALELAKKVVGGDLAVMAFSVIFEGEKMFSIIEGNGYFVEEKNITTYVITLNKIINSDNYCLFVPLDGSEVWFGWMNPDGTYYCFSQIDLLNFDIKEFIDEIMKLINEAEQS